MLRHFALARNVRRPSVGRPFVKVSSMSHPSDRGFSAGILGGGEVGTTRRR